MNTFTYVATRLVRILVDVNTGIPAKPLKALKANILPPIVLHGFMSNCFNRSELNDEINNSNLGPALDALYVILSGLMVNTDIDRDAINIHFNYMFTLEEDLSKRELVIMMLSHGLACCISTSNDRYTGGQHD